MVGGEHLLPEELVEEILLKLPVKSITRFESVSKSWKSLISSKRFITRHQKKRKFLILQISHVDGGHRRVCVSVFAPDKPAINLSFLGDDAYYGVRNCGGLICFDKTSDDDDILLYNPTTNESKFLPPTTLSNNNVFCNGFCVGFGFDLQSKNYKVVRFPLGICRSVLGVDEAVYMVQFDRFEVYSLDDDRWKMINLDVNFFYLSEDLRSVYVNGSLYWVGYDSYEDCRCVVSFNLTDETFSSLPFPPMEIPSFSYHEFHLVDCNNGSLGIVVICPDDSGDGKSFKFWVLVDGNGSSSSSSTWTQVFNVHLYGVETCLGFFKDGNYLFLMSEQEDSQILVYDFETRKLYRPQLNDVTTSVGILKKCYIHIFEWIQFLPYVETTISLSKPSNKEREEDIQPISYVESTILLNDEILQGGDEVVDEEEKVFVDEEEKEFVDEELMRNIWHA